MNRSELEAAERAEFIQSVKSLLIPLCLFLACVIMAAGTFLIYNHEPLGWAFALLSASIIVTCMIAFIRFQNTHRARGILKHGLAEPSAELDTPHVNGTDAAVDTDSHTVVESGSSSDGNAESNVIEFKPTKQRQNQ